VAAHHCSLLAAGEAVVVEDRSGGGTFVNGARVEGRTALRAGDRLQLGRSGRELALIALSGAEDEG
jgi:pSer/pThr/pTyr-binding forkhead associated (FHA) protein